MSDVYFDDGTGHSLKLQRYGEDGYLANSFFPTTSLENIHNIHIRDDDTILCSYGKSGCHWLWEVTRMLQAGTKDVEVREKEDYMIEFNSQNHLDQLPPNRILNTHVLFRQLPQKVKDGRAKILFIYRNPKDVAVSFYNHIRKMPGYDYHGEFKDYFRNLFCRGFIEGGDYFAYMREWEREMDDRPGLPVFTLSYEDLQADTFTKVRQLAEFVDSSADDNTIRDIMSACSISNMRDRKGHMLKSETGESIMYRKGKVGDWKNWFSVTDSEAMDELCREKMKGSRFQLKFTL